MGELNGPGPSSPRRAEGQDLPRAVCATPDMAVRTGRMQGTGMGWQGHRGDPQESPSGPSAALCPRTFAASSPRPRDQATGVS
mmetsp:Transcript_15783/g.25214  ORF Transcript_15783/g.25214 Transcript_15783/m.25214 type:complete len:83 (-) Transcript_15783:365-613(-)